MMRFSNMPAARRCRELAKTPDECLRVLAKNLDLPMEDSETLDFLRTALRETDKELHTAELEWRIARVKEDNHDSHE